MLNHSTRRWLAGLGVVGAFVAASATPAAAKKPAVELGLYMTDTTIASGSEGKTESPTLSASEPVVVHGLTVRYDFRDLTDKVTVAPEIRSECDSSDAGILVCQDPFEVGLDEWGLAGLFAVTIKPTSEATDGDSGDLKVTVSAEGMTPASHTATVKIGEGVDLAGGTEVNLTTSPGSSFTAPLVLGNVGESTVKGAVAVFDHDHAIRTGKRYSNCTYEGDQLRVCRFTNEVASGETLTATVQYVLGKDTYAPGREHGYYQWMTPSEFDDFVGHLDSGGHSIGKPGSDEPLVLTKKAPVKAGSFQADVDPENNWSGMEITVTGKNGADLEAIGDKLTGKAGEVVTATVGVRNNGPASLDFGRSGSPVTKIDVAVPKGATAVEVPESCVPLKDDQGDWEQPGKPGADAYRCYPDFFLAAGEKQTVDIGLKVDAVVPDATGTVVINAKCECEGFTEDTNPANDTAKILLNPTNGQGGGQGDGDDDGGSLPITGESTTLIAGIGALLLAAGVGGFVLARRRKTRFVA
ncbi:LPXTG cell wall anchor domain-containing protein [Micromonospora sp. NPDC005367]|uniref:LPXTG cell wall anchor domain-containing protein n=1 Tax=Micromonospora sp. NPDC005367 TaxID=3155590 RepID=UPI0033B8DE42